MINRRKMINRLITLTAAAALMVSTTVPSFADGGWHGGGWHGGHWHGGGGWGWGPAIGLGVGLGVLGAAIATAPY